MQAAGLFGVGLGGAGGPALVTRRGRRGGAVGDATTGTGPSTDELVIDRAALFTRPVEP